MSSTHQDDKIKNSQILVRARTSSTSSSGLTLQTPRTARFAEATSVNSPVDPSTAGRNPFRDPPVTTQHLMPQPQPSDVGFGYLADGQASKHSSYAGVEVPLTPNSPLKSALKPPGTPGRLANPLSPTFHEEQILEKREDHTEKQNAKDVVRWSLWKSHLRRLTSCLFRKSKLGCEWPRCVFEGPILAAVSSFWLCCRRLSPSSIPHAPCLRGVAFLHGLQDKRLGLKSPCLALPASPLLCPLPSSTLIGKEDTSGLKRLPYTTQCFRLLFSHSA